MTVARDALAEDGTTVTRFAMGTDTIEISVSQDSEFNFAQTVGRTSRVLAGPSPDTVQSFEITQTARPFDTNTIVIDRSAVDQPDGARCMFDSVDIQSTPLSRTSPLYVEEFNPDFWYNIRPTFTAGFIDSDNLELTNTLTANDIRFRPIRLLPHLLDINS